MDSRHALIIKAIHERKRTILGELEWKTVPWTKHAKSTKHLVLEALVEIPGMLEDFDTISGIDDTKEQQQQYSRLLGSCWAHDALLIRWNDTWQSVTSVEDDALLLYWASCLFLYSSTALLSGKLDTPKAQLPERVTNLGQYIDRLAEAIPKFFEDGTPREAVLMGIFPLGVCLQFMLLTEHSPSNMGSKHSELVSDAPGDGGKQTSSLDSCYSDSTWEVRVDVLEQSAAGQGCSPC